MESNQVETTALRPGPVKQSSEDRLKAARELARLRRIKRELEEDKNIPWFSDISHLIKPNGRSLNRSPKGMENYTKRPVGQKVIFEIEGQSMTCEDPAKSIPDGCKVLAKRLQGDPAAIPVNRSLILIFKECESDEASIYCKNISHVWTERGYFMCKSLNPDPSYKPFPVDFIDVIEMFEVERVISND